MPTSNELLQIDAGVLPGDALPGDVLPGIGAPGQGCEPCCVEFSELLEQAFRTRFTILDGLTGDVLSEATGQPSGDWGLRVELCLEVARRGRPEFIHDEDPFLVLALPQALSPVRSQVAVATFVTRRIGSDEDLSRSAELLGMRTGEAVAWASRQTPLSADALMRIAEMALIESRSVRRIKELEEEAASLSAHVSNTYEEISLLYRLTQNLKISQSDEQLSRLALEWLKEVVPASALAIQLVPAAQPDESLDHQARTESVLIIAGDCPVDNQQFTALIEHVDHGAGQSGAGQSGAGQSGAGQSGAEQSSANRPVVLNYPVTSRGDWPYPKVRQMIVVPLAEGKNLFGYLAALNHTDDGEFGTVEASLLSSVAAILGIHGGNIELYRQQSELMSGIIRALTSAIDAKDPYTCGHSDRVARVSVRLAEELGCDAKTVNTIYLSGLLHDVGKIGIDDNVLRKPGKLSHEEFEHIKQHPEIGHKILSDLGKLDEVLPAILYHHESWDGGGYPHQLGAERIPLSARIVGVADAFDAMGSDRPYRKGMPDEKIDAILRAGAGQQWDESIIGAFFRIRDDVREIARGEQEAADGQLIATRSTPD